MSLFARVVFIQAEWVVLLNSGLLAVTEDYRHLSRNRFNALYPVEVEQISFWLVNLTSLIHRALPEG
jgi:hypothetical protein